MSRVKRSQSATSIGSEALAPLRRRSRTAALSVSETPSGVVEPSPGETVRMSAQTVLLRDELAVPNRALALLERHGDSWRFVRAHLWFETGRRVEGTVAIVRSRT